MFHSFHGSGIKKMCVFYSFCEAFAVSGLMNFSLIVEGTPSASTINSVFMGMGCIECTHFLFERRVIIGKKNLYLVEAFPLRHEGYNFSYINRVIIFPIHRMLSFPLCTEGYHCSFKRRVII